MAEPFWVILLAGWISVWDILRTLIVLLVAYMLTYGLIKAYFQYQTEHHIDLHDHIANTPLCDPSHCGTPQVSKDE